MWIAQGRLSEAWAWARERGLSAADDLSYVREFEHVTLARLLLAQGARDRADHAIDEAIGPPGAPAGSRDGRAAGRGA